MMLKILVATCLAAALVTIYWFAGADVAVRPQGSPEMNRSSDPNVTITKPNPVRVEAPPKLPTVRVVPIQEAEIDAPQVVRVWGVEAAAELLQSDLDEVLNALLIAPGGEIQRSPKKLQLAQEALDDAKTEFRALFVSHGQAAAEVAFALEASGEGKLSAADNGKRFRWATVGKTRVFYTAEQYPEVFQLEDALLAVPSRLEDQLRTIADGK